jgi:hypothetical protein
VRKKRRCQGQGKGVRNLIPFLGPFLRAKSSVIVPSRLYFNHNGVLPMHISVNEHEENAADREECKLHRWLVSFASESGWYPVGEFVALEASVAIDRAVEVFGPGAAYQAEMIPWDAAPLFKATLPAGG